MHLPPPPCCCNILSASRTMLSTPISKLPSDVLYEVFHTVRRSVTSNMKSPTGILCGWLGLTHVCQYWRDLALSSTMMWTDIDITTTTSVDMVTAFLTRSQSAALRITIGRLSSDQPIDAENVCTLMHEVSKHAHRLQSLRVDGTGNNDLRMLLSIFSEQSSLVQKLRLLMHVNMVLPTLLGGLIPSLRYAGAMQAPQWRMFTNITELRLSDSKLPAERLFATLRNNPMLQVVWLSIELVSLRVSSPSLRADDIVHLPHLRLFTLALPTVGQMRMLDFVSFPATTIVHLQYAPHPGPTHAFQVCAPLIKATTHARSAIFDIGEASLGSSHRKCHSRLYCPGQFSLTVQWSGGYHNPGLEYTAFGAVPLPQLKGLVIRAGSHFTRRQWNSILSNVPTTTSLLVYCRGPQVFPMLDALAALGEDSATQRSDTDTMLLLPGLSNLGVVYTARDSLTLTTICQKVLACFNERAIAGARLKKCTVSYVSPPYLKKRVAVINIAVSDLGEVTVEAAPYLIELANSFPAPPL